MLVISFRNFCPDKPCESLHTQKTRQVFFEAEPNYWMILVGQGIGGEGGRGGSREGQVGWGRGGGRKVGGGGMLGRVL